MRREHSGPPLGALTAGTAVGSYILEEAIGAGACATVYRARARGGGQPACVKVLHRLLVASPKMLERFRREVEALERLSHPAIVDIYEVGQLADGSPYFAMELIEGQDLRTVLAERGRVGAAEAFELVAPIASALETAHAAGIIHRDLKAANVLVAGPPGARTVKLVDFGVAKLSERDSSGGGLTSIGRAVGTPLAMAPEQIRGEPVGPATDIYALGILLFQLLTCRHPFPVDDPLSLEIAHLETPAPRPSQWARLEPALDAVVLRCLAKRPADRYGSAANLLADLARACGAPRPRPADPPIEALAVYVETRVADLDDDDALDEQEWALEHAAVRLARAGFVSAFETGGSLVAVRPLPGPDAVGERQAALRAAADVNAMIAGQRLQIAARVLVHAGPARFERRGSELRVLGGPLLDLRTWGAPTATSWWASEAATAGLAWDADLIAVKV